MTGSQNDRVLAVLRDGNPKSIQTIHQQVGPCRLNSRIADLRKRGHDIKCWRAKLGRDSKGRDAWTYYYRLVPPPLEAAADGNPADPLGSPEAAAPSGTAAPLDQPALFDAEIREARKFVEGHAWEYQVRDAEQRRHG